MSAAFIRSDLMRKLASVVCLMTLPAAAQQANVQTVAAPAEAQVSVATPDQQGGKPAAAVPDAPQPQTLTQPTHVDYAKPVRLFPNPFARYVPREVPPPIFTNAPRIRDLIQNGKVMLSMNDAVAIALVDNLDVAIARYNLPIADTDILATKGGAGPRGVSGGVIQNTPGGGLGGISAGVTGAGAGGTSAGAGGAGAGAGGIVSTTAGAGPPPPNFDPSLNLTASWERFQQLQNFTLLAGGTALASQNTTIGDISYNQGFSPGTALSVGFNNSRVSSNNPSLRFNPALNSNFTARITQHLLQGFGPSLNTRLIRQAKNTKKITELGFRQQVIITVSQIESIYWDLVNAFEDYKVKERSLALAQKTLSDNQKQVEIGTLAPLDVVRAESNVATAEQDLIVSKTNLQLQQLFVKNALTRSLPNDDVIMQMEIIPTDTVQIPEQENLPAVEELIKIALTSRPDYNQQKIVLQNSEINLKGTNQGLLPIVDVFGFYGATGLAGVQNPLATCSATVTTNCILPGTVPTTGFGDAFTNLFNSSAPNKGVGFNIQIPLGN